MIRSITSTAMVASASNCNGSLWHQCTGHPSDKVLLKMFPNLSPPDEACEDCIVAKMCRVPFKSSLSVWSEAIELVHADVWGPSPIIDRNGHKYFLLLVDGKNKFCWLYLLFWKNEVVQLFKYLLFKTIKSDNRGEFIDEEIDNFYKNDPCKDTSAKWDMPEEE